MTRIASLKLPLWALLVLGLAACGQPTGPSPPAIVSEILEKSAGTLDRKVNLTGSAAINSAALGEFVASLQAKGFNEIDARPCAVMLPKFPNAKALEFQGIGGHNDIVVVQTVQLCVGQRDNPKSLDVVGRIAKIEKSDVLSPEEALAIVNGKDPKDVLK